MGYISILLADHAYFQIMVKKYNYLLSEIT